MYCPFCGHDETKVIDSRLVAGGSQIKRRRECSNCGERFSTYEEAELVMPRIIKTNGRREPFDEVKLRAGFHKALEKLKELDQVAYVRFASVYQNFQDVKDFTDEISELSKK